MKNRNPKIIISAFSVIIGILIAIQIKLNVETYIPITLASIQNTKYEIDSINEENKKLEKLIKTKEEEFEALKNISTSEDNIIDILSADLKKNRMKSGYVDLEGPGIEIKMYDNVEDYIVGYDINDDVIHDVDILNILNDLKISGAEAISINGQRLLSISEIKCGGPIIRINDKSLGTPFTISAIGNSKTLNAAVNAPGTYGDTLKNVYKIGFETEMKDNLLVPGYAGRFDFQYAKPVGEGD